jgi:hypothetical protein
MAKSKKLAETIKQVEVYWESLITQEELVEKLKQLETRRAERGRHN